MFNATALNDDGLDFGLIGSQSALNGAAVNAHAVNGEVVADIALDGALSVTLGAGMIALRGAPLVGQIDIDVASAMTGYGGIMGEGDMEITLATGFDPSVRIPLLGSAGLSLSASLVGAAGRMGYGEIQLGLSADFDLTRRAMASGQIDIGTVFTLDGRILGKVFLEGDINLFLSLGLDGKRAVTHRPEFPLDMEVGLNGGANLTMVGEGVAAIELPLSGEARLGNRIGISGQTSFDLYASMGGRRYALVPIEGGSAFQLLLAQDGVGRPAIPADFSRAPRDRTFRVGPDSRLMRTHSNRRLN